MPIKVGDCGTYIAVTLAAAAAIMSAPGQAKDPYHIGRFLLSTAAPEADAMAGAIGDDPESLLSH